MMSPEKRLMVRFVAIAFPLCLLCTFLAIAARRAGLISAPLSFLLSTVCGVPIGFFVMNYLMRKGGKG